MPFFGSSSKRSGSPKAIEQRRKSLVDATLNAFPPDSHLLVIGVDFTPALRYALGMPAYRSHFERMGFAQELRRIEASDSPPNPAFVSAIGAASDACPPGRSIVQMATYTAMLDSRRALRGRSGRLRDSGHRAAV